MKLYKYKQSTVDPFTSKTHAVKKVDNTLHPSADSPFQDNINTSMLTRLTNKSEPLSSLGHVYNER